jgi:hypothetical protein
VLCITEGTEWTILYTREARLRRVPSSADVAAGTYEVTPPTDYVLTGTAANGETVTGTPRVLVS